MLEALTIVVKALVSSYGALQSFGDKRRERLAVLCDAIADVLDQYSKSPADRRESVNLCAQLRQYVAPIRAVASGVTNPEKIEELAQALDTVCENWGRISAEGALDSESHQASLEQINDAAGTFRGSALLLRAGVSTPPTRSA